MRLRLRPINKYLIYDILGMIIYGLILYFGFTWLAGFSLLYAYIWDFVLIILTVALDGYANKVLQSDKTITLLKEKYNAENTYHMIRGGFISFKALIYLFYVFLLVASKIIDFSPTLVGENLADFIRANDYSIVFLLAFDSLLKQFSEDRERMKKISKKLQEPSEDANA